MYSICVYEKCSEFLICGGLQPSIHPACSDIHCAPLVDIPFTGMNGNGMGHPPSCTEKVWKSAVGTGKQDFEGMPGERGLGPPIKVIILGERHIKTND